MITKKQRRLQELIAQYNEQVHLCLEEFQSAVIAYCDGHDREKLAEDSVKVRRAESRADDIRREIEVLMYSKALFPESRGDILGLLETMDKVPNQAEAAVRMVLNQHLVIPADLVPETREMVQVSRHCIEEMIGAVDSLFSNSLNATAYVGKVDQLESDVDHLEEQLISRIFTGSEEGWMKILLRDFVRKVASISDRAENTTDRIRIMVAKRSI